VTKCLHILLIVCVLCAVSYGAVPDSIPEPDKWYDFVIPDSLSGSFSIRERQSSGLEWEIRTGLSYSTVTVEYIRELENGKHYWGYAVNGNQILRYGLTTEVDLVQNQAADINRQTMMVGRKFGIFEFGVYAGIASEYWNAPDDAYTLYMPLPYGHIRHVTDFTRKVSIWSSEVKIVHQAAQGRLFPYIKWNWLQDNNKSNWKIKLGAGIRL